MTEVRLNTIVVNTYFSEYHIIFFRVYSRNNSRSTGLQDQCQEKKLHSELLLNGNPSHLVLSSASSFFIYSLGWTCEDEIL